MNRKGKSIGFKELAKVLKENGYNVSHPSIDSSFEPEKEITLLIIDDPLCPECPNET